MFGPTSAVPALLQGAFAGEPLFVDLRWAKAETSLSLRHSQFRAAILDIVATVQGRSKDELDGEDVQQNRRNRRWAWGAVIALTLLTVSAALAAVIAVVQRNAAEDRRQIALSRQVATQSLQALGDRRLDTALLLALESGKVLTSERTAIPSGTFEARSSLLAALQDGSVPIAAYWRSGSPFAFSPDGRTFASAEGSSIVIRETRTRQPIGRPLPGHKNPLRAIAFSRDGKLLASTSENNVMLLSLVGPDPAARQTTIEYADALAISPDGKTLAIGAAKTIHLLGAADLKPLAPPLLGHSSNVVSLAYSRDGGILASGSWDGTVGLWDMATHQPIGPALQGYSGQVESVAFSPDDRMLATGGGDGVRLWDMATRQPVGPVLAHAGGVKSVAFSPDGSLLASGSGGTRGTIILWSTTKREPVGPPLHGHTRWISEVAFSPDGATLASLGGEDVTLFWDLRSSSRLGLVLPGDRNTEDAIAMSRDGARAASSLCLLRDAADKPCRQGGLRVWDLAARTELWTRPTGCAEAPSSLAFRSGTRRPRGGRLSDPRRGRRPLQRHRSADLECRSAWSRPAGAALHRRRPRPLAVRVERRWRAGCRGQLRVRCHVERHLRNPRMEYGRCRPSRGCAGCAFPSFDGVQSRPSDAGDQLAERSRPVGYFHRQAAQRAPARQRGCVLGRRQTDGGRAAARLVATKVHLALGCRHGPAGRRVDPRRA